MSTTPTGSDRTTHQPAVSEPVPPTAITTQGRREVVDREKQEHGGVKVGSAFFGWVTATGIAVLLTAVLVAAGTAIGLAAVDDLDQVTDSASDQVDTIGLVGGIALLVVVFLAYVCGGYVAGRMARFDGLRQGLAVWLWAVLVAVVVAVVAAVAGSRYDVLSQLNSFPRIPLDAGDVTTGGLVALGAVAAASLVGALLGGVLGMRFHRSVDRTGLGD
ncbi:hypothetical protein [Nocardioides rubriscoriae]|uniref:hypothetical protein n=1 Tax=Nocardioides rubriscoriae TaxID=642762 RepID=UPI001B86D99F|nr:hypothetical protein [Nocardioides rubriscoriae]